MGEQQQQLKFPGFPEKPKENYWQYPEVMNGFWHTLTPIEQKILDYILRHTWGWHKNSDYISYEQIRNGIPNIDKGTGIKSKTTLNKGLKGLEKKNMIRIVSGKEKGIANLYYLVLEEGVQEMNRGSIKSGQGGSIKGEHTINNTINTNNNISKEIQKSALSYGNEDINYLINRFKELTGLNKLDGSEKINRRYCWLCLKKIGNRQKVENLIKIAVASDFHRVNLTSFKYLYYHCIKIANEFKDKIEHPRYVKIK